ncbi:iron-sulfur cluster co-chaperone HscB C-terminal domain-containing protein [Hymenobacter baengnokdamensis]|uniref:iron-sulfur cluster co-chaperone HscB C-terminal domain-containing protein n=1 Tax=Hymenobacter baengnokdamensis TaxID=2615203 RepID=UPI001E551661|nr:iron-sulfur cluster co-chaperone HscB C-terminal domain-containing protein [Hymenobacter baengnokdamensis]
MPDSPNYFAFYGLPEAFLLDEAALKGKYYQLSRELHPDFHAQDTPAAQAEALRLSTLNTDAYRTLADPDCRMAYVLAQHGLLEEGSAQNQLPADFLMEVMDLNEQLMELEFEPDPTASARLEAEVATLATTLDAGIEPVLAGYSGLPPTTAPLPWRKCARIT